jgi:hypothetical protein
MGDVRRRRRRQWSLTHSHQREEMDAGRETLHTDQPTSITSAQTRLAPKHIAEPDGQIQLTALLE